MRSRKASVRRWHRAVTRLEVIVVLGVVVLCAALIPMTLLRRTALMRRGMCQHNLGLIGSALYTYAEDNREMFPIAAHPAATQDRIGNVEYVRQIGAYRGRRNDPQAGDTGRMLELPTRLSTTRNLWTLFRLGLITRDKFICPSTRDVANQESNAEQYWDFGVGDIDGPATPEQSRMGYSQISYGYQVPYGRHGRPKLDVALYWLVADRGPYGAALETGASNFPPAFPVALSPKYWRPWNSPNHSGEGQNILHVESHVEFHRTPAIYDNIYAQNALSAKGSVAASTDYGVPPAPGAKLVPGPRGLRYDTLIYP